MSSLPLDPKTQAYLTLHKELERLRSQLVIIQQQMKKAQQCVETVQNFAILSKSM
jgi:prefoldin subunit 5